MKLLSFLQQSISRKISSEEQIAFLKQTLHITPKELALVVRFLRTQMTCKLRLPNAIDICGTGGSGLPRINTSTIAAMILARLGVGIAKHGNKAASGRFGSFDLLESLGVKFGGTPADIEKKYTAEHLAFLFAPSFHPVMRHFADARKRIGKPTFFNLLGPLLNPALPKRQIIGTPFKDKMHLIAETCRLLGKEAVYVVCGEDGLDEVTLTGKTFVTKLYHGKIRSYALHPRDFKVPTAAFTKIQGGDANVNTAIARDILAGTCTTRHRDLVLVNVALALKLTGKVQTLHEGYQMALGAIQMPSILRQIIEHKRQEIDQQKRNSPLKRLTKDILPSTRNFASAISGKGLSFIAEIKKASPSNGIIANRRFSPVAIANQYEQDGANAISVLCDTKFFSGSLTHLKNVAKNTIKTPLLCKDFIIDEYQIYEARKNGADAVLLIAAILTEEQITRFMTIATLLRMASVCEVHTLKELKAVLNTSATIIGINNRDLHTFTINIGTTEELARHIPKDKIIISESGFASKKDVDRVRPLVNAILIGTALMKGRSIRTLARTKIKICGVRSVQEAQFCQTLGVDFIGLNFVPTSKRCISITTARAICRVAHKIATVGIFQNQSIATVNRLAKTLNLDYIQLSGNEPLSFVQHCCRPVIKTISIKTKQDVKMSKQFLPHVAHLLFDSPTPGSGKLIPVTLKNISFPFLLAGGVSPENVKNLVENCHPFGIDVASGVETNDALDFKKIRSILNQLTLC